MKGMQTEYPKARIQVTLTKPHCDEIRAAAKNAGMSTAVWSRYVLLQVARQQRARDAAQAELLDDTATP